MSNIDLSELDVVASANAGVEVELLHPVTSEPLGGFISILGADSDVFRRAVNARAQRQLMKGKSRRSAITVNDVEAESVKIIAACTTGWRDIVVDGAELVFSLSAATDLYKKYPWIKEQVDLAMGDRSVFLPK